MNAQTEQTGSGLADILKWVVVIALLATAVVGNHYFSEETLLIRVVAILVIGALAFFIASKTNKGTTALGFAKEARIEGRKVVWPTRQETVQTTLVIMVAVVFMSLLLWGIDAVLVKIVAFALGQEI